MNLSVLRLTLLAFAASTFVFADDKAEVEAQHKELGMKTITSTTHTQHPDAQWFPEAGLGLFIHWDEGSVLRLETSWPMIAGTHIVWQHKEIKDNPDEYARIIREKDYNLDGKQPITPNIYWDLAKKFNPDDYHPNVWLKKAKEAGFTYAVLTTKHHSGLALWPSNYGDFSTKNTPMNGRDLVKEYVDACRAADLKVGLYFSAQDWHFDRDYKNFLTTPVAAKYKKLPELNADWEPRTVKHSQEEIAAHQEAYAQMIRGQLKELLTNYGKIDLLWFDGYVHFPTRKEKKVVTDAELREFQPGLVINPRLCKGDFLTYEKVMPDDLRLKADEWGEFCTFWAGAWSYMGRPFTPFNDIATKLVKARAAGLNFLLDVGPMSSGNLDPAYAENFDKLGTWMKLNGEAIYGTRALPPVEKANTPGVSKGQLRYFFLIPPKKDSKDAPLSSVSISGLKGSFKAQMLGKSNLLPIKENGDSLNIAVPPEADPNKSTIRVLKLFPAEAK